MFLCHFKEKQWQAKFKFYSNQQTMASPIKIQIPIQRKQWQVQCQFKQIIQ